MYKLIHKTSLLAGFFKPNARSISIDLKNLPKHRSLVIERYGDPKENVILKTDSPEEILPNELCSKQVLVEHLAACINPADINFMQGVYGYRPELPSIAGGEGIMRVMSISPDVTHLKPGDLTLGPNLYNYWQSHSVRDSDQLFKIDNALNVSTAAQLKVNPCTAYRMIKDFQDLRAGDTLIQNGANSAVGLYVIQLAKHWGIKTINVIRDRPNKDELIKELKNYGADVVLTEAEVSNVECIKPVLKEVGKPKLALNCVGGKNANDCHRTLDYRGCSVTYGAMSRQPFSLTGSSIFKQHKYVFFWITSWYNERERHEISTMLDEVGDMFKKGILKPKPTTMISFEERNTAFGGGSSDTKFLFSINK